MCRLAGLFRRPRVPPRRCGRKRGLGGPLGPGVRARVGCTAIVGGAAADRRTVTVLRAASVRRTAPVLSTVPTLNTVPVARRREPLTRFGGREGFEGFGRRPWTRRSALTSRRSRRRRGRPRHTVVFRTLRVVRGVREPACLGVVTGLGQQFGHARAAVPFEGTPAPAFGVGAVPFCAAAPFGDLVRGGLGVARGRRAVLVGHAPTPSPETPGHMPLSRHVRDRGVIGSPAVCAIVRTSLFRDDTKARTFYTELRCMTSPIPQPGSSWSGFTNAVERNAY
ncbi:hypothetical protein FB384_001976 [Prauserella sediminis]|uniref:Uncharacterized protein n=1 Tax=Prauserella sediminis TaxID=577680 RepID=A0A839XGI4_9PSEU|nr:hypothetical protein [Prauserella sediminis]